MANITVTASNPVVNVSSTNNTVNVSQTTSTVNVSLATGLSQSAIRGYFGNTFPILYDVSTGVYSIDSDSIVDETVVSNGVLSGNITLDLNAGRMHKVTLNGDVTGLTLANVASGRSATVIFSQDATGSHALDTTTFPSNWTTWEFANQNTDLDENGTNFTVMSVFYDGSNYYASLVPESAQQISTSDIANLAITTDKLAANAVTSAKIDFTSFDTDSISVGSTNLYFTNALARASVSASGDLSYNSTTGVFSFTNDAGDIESVTAGDGLTGGGTTGNVTLDVGAGNGITVNADNVAVDMSVFSTSDLSEGTNLYYTTDRANTAIGAYTGALTNLTGNITTTGVLSAGASATDVHSLTGNLNVTGNVEVSGNLNYRNVEDLYVRDQSITLNANAATDATSSIIINRPVAGSNTVIRWNETSDIWEFTNDGSTYYPIPTSTSDLAEGTNLYYTTARSNTDFDARLATSNTDSLSEGTTNLYYTDARSNTAFDTRLLDSSVTKLVNNIKIQDLAISSDAANNVTSYYLPNTSPGSAGQYLISTSGTQLGFADFSDDANTAISEKLLDATRKNAFDLRVQDLSVSSDAANGTISYYFPNSQPGSAGQILLSSDATNLGFSDFTDEANTAIGAYQGNINTAGTIDATGNITTSGFFLGDIDGAVVTDVRNETGSTLNKGKAVYLTGTSTGDTPHVALADSDDASKMPALGIIRENISNASVGQAVTSGSINVASHGFTEGADLYVSTTAGDLTTTRPTGEATKIQKIGKVVGPNHIQVQGAFRSNETPNLDDGAIFAGNSTNQAVAVDTTTNFDVSDTEFDLANALSNVNSIQSESGSNVTLDTAGGTGTNFTKTQGVTADTLGITVNPGGYSSTVRKTSPTYAGTANITTFIATGNATSGSPNIVLSAAVELNYQNLSPTNTDFGNATTLADCLSYLSANMVFRTGSLYDYSLAPFPAGTRISSVDAANNIITMNNNATADFEFENTSGSSYPFYRADNKILFLGQGAYDEDTGLIEQYYSLYDFAYNTDRNTFINTEFGWYANFYNPVNPYTGGYGYDGPTVSDLSLSFTNDGNLSLGTQPTIQKTKLEADSTFLELEDGLVMGGANPTRRMIGNVGDYSPIPAINMLYSGNESWTDKFNNGGASGDWPSGIYGQPQLQLGLKQFTDNSAQNASPQIGPRIFFSSAKGKLNDSEYTHYPRAGQEIGRITWWGTHGDDLAPAQNSPPAFMTVQASDDWTAGSNASMYFTGTSNWQGINTNDLWLAYERGNVILASGQNSGDVSKNAGITFAPARAVGNNPKDIYDFSGNSATSLHQTFAKVNYANVSANSGAKVSVTHGASIGAGTVGDQVLSISRNDNSYTLLNQTETSWNRFYDKASAPGSPSGDLVRTNTTNNDLNNQTVTFSDVVDANWTFLNGNTYVLRDEGILSGRFLTLYDSSNTSPIIQAATFSGGSPVGTATYNVTVTSGVTDYEYTLELPEQESNLYIKANATTAIKITDTTEVNFTNIPVLPSHSNTSLPSAGTAGGMIYITNGNNKPAYSNGSAWLYVFDNSAVT